MGEEEIFFKIYVIFHIFHIYLIYLAYKYVINFAIFVIPFTYIKAGTWERQGKVKAKNTNEIVVILEIC